MLKFLLVFKLVSLYNFPCIQHHTNTCYLVSYKTHIPRYRLNFLKKDVETFGKISDTESKILITENVKTGIEEKTFFLQTDFFLNQTNDLSYKRFIDNYLYIYEMPLFIVNKEESNRIHLYTTYLNPRDYLKVLLESLSEVIVEFKTDFIDKCDFFIDAYTAKNQMMEVLENKKRFLFFIRRKKTLVSFFKHFRNFLISKKTKTLDSVSKFFINMAQKTLGCYEIDSEIIIYMLIDLMNVWSLYDDINEKFVIYEVNQKDLELVGILVSEIRLDFIKLDISDVKSITIMDDKQNRYKILKQVNYKNFMYIYIDNKNFTDFDSKFLFINIHVGKFLYEKIIPIYTK